MVRRPWRELAWIAVPFAAYLFVLQRLWFDAPIHDDYYIALSSVMMLWDAHSPRDWLHVLLAQHAEHRIAVVRLAALGVAHLFGHMEFRALTLLGNFTVLGLALLAWAEFRHAVSAPFIGAAAIVLMQWSYFEASIMPTAALPNIGVLFFASACLFFATRPGARSVAASLAFALLAAGSQGNGLFALPLAAAAAFLMGRPSRAAIFGAAGAVLIAAYFWGYQRPPYFPSPFLILSQPIAGMQFFLMVLGGIAPGRWPPMALGVALVGVVAWLAWRRTWTRFPAATLFVAFVLLSAAAVTAGRAASGALPSPRHAVYSSWLVAIAFLAACAQLQWSGRRLEALAVAGAVAAAVAVTCVPWRWITDFSLVGHMLVKIVPADSRVVVPDAYSWTLHASPAESRGILASAESRRLYSPPVRSVHAPGLRTSAGIPPHARVEGVIDEVVVAGDRVKLSGWSPILATAPGRTLAVYPGEAMPLLARYELAVRPDVAMTMRDASLVISGFRAELAYPSEQAAQRAAARLCIVDEAPGLAPVLLSRAGASCAVPSVR